MHRASHVAEKRLRYLSQYVVLHKAETGSSPILNAGFALSSTKLWRSFVNAHRIPQEEDCPVPESVLGDLYRSKPEGLQALVATITPSVRAMLAVYCYRRTHLHSIALAIASSCDKEDLIIFGGDPGAALFEQARRSPTHQSGKRKVSLSHGALIQYVIDQDLA